MTSNSEHPKRGVTSWAWRPRVQAAPLLLPYALLICVALALFWPSTSSLLKAWESGASDDTYSHGYLVAAICCWLAWKRLRVLGSEPAKPNFSAAVLLVCTSLGWLIALRAGFQTAHQALLPLLLLLAVAAAFGTRIASRTAVAVGYLLFAIPVWSVINGVLQRMTVVVAEFLLRATGVTASVTGNFIALPSGVFEVAGGCSGLHYFIVAFALGALYGELDDSSVRDRIRLIVLALILALVANWLRVYLIVVAGYLTDMQHYLVRVDHSTFGWFVFAVAMIPFFLIGRRWSRPVDDPAAQRTASAEQPSLVSGRGLIITLLALCVAPLLNVLSAARPADFSAPELPRNPGVWTGPVAAQPTRWSPYFVGADAITRADYLSGTRRIEAFVALYSYQEQGKELTGYQNSLEGEQLTVVGRAHSADSAANELVLEHDGHRSLIWYFYEVGGLTTSRALVAQLYYGLNSLVGAPISKIIAWRTECQPADCTIAREDLLSLLESLERLPSYSTEDTARDS